MIAPYILRAKLFFQALWQTKQGWDETIPAEDLAPFLEWLKELDDLTSFRESRFYRSVATILLVIQVHVFGDTSLDAFCAVGYFRFLYPDGSIQCCFIMEGTRVAPLRQFMSIPKLELQAAVLCVRLLNVIKTEHTYEISSYYIWTDSTTVLQWIRSDRRRHQTFIANRIAEIQDDSYPSERRHDPGRLNEADDGSRGFRLASLDPECRWLNGPAFLTLPVEFCACRHRCPSRS